MTSLSFFMASIRDTFFDDRGCFLRVSLNLRVKISSIASTNTNSTFRLPSSLRPFMISGNFLISSMGFRASIPTAISGVAMIFPSIIWDTRFDNRLIGRLSTQYKPISSRVFRAIVFPAPDRPLIIISRRSSAMIIFHLAE